MDTEKPLLSAKQLAFMLNRHINYIYCMKKAGFEMPGNRSSLEDCLRWLTENPSWRQYEAVDRRHRVN